MTPPTPGSTAWLAQVAEPALDPEQPIIDPHHHLWRGDPGRLDPYLLAQLWADTGSGHRIEKTVFVECRASWRREGPEHLRPVGETEFVQAVARASREGGGGAVIAGIVAHADLRLPEPMLREVLAAHEHAAQGLFRGIRHSGACDPHPQALSIPGRAPPGLYADPDFRRGLALLGRLGLSYDTWHYHHQNAAFAELARAVPDTVLVLDHFGTPLGVGPYAGQQETIFSAWQRDIEALAGCPNVVAKIGGLAMPDNGFGWDRRATPATSDELVAAQARYYRHTLDCFGPGRCMFESNFPVDRRSLPYAAVWNGFKKMAARCTAEDRQALFHDNAARVYRL
jgi:predicted TIM-barrel fold metal-dependent hydrolase